MRRRIRRGLVIAAVAVSLVGGVLSIRVAADLAAAAAPPPAPPVSLQAIQAQLTAEQARALSLQQQLEDLQGVTGELTAALESTESQVTEDGSAAKELRSRLKAAEARLAVVTKLLKEAAARLRSLGVAGPTVPPAKPPANGGGSTAKATPKPTAPPTAPPAAAFTLSLRLAGGGVDATWTTCSVSGFDSYALVRSTDREIHYPPEDHDTLVASVGSRSTTSASDPEAPSGRLWYRVYCLVRPENERKVAATTSTVSIDVP